jgi:hypothetical protein
VCTIHGRAQTSVRAAGTGALMPERTKGRAHCTRPTYPHALQRSGPAPGAIRPSSLLTRHTADLLLPQLAHATCRPLSPAEETPAGSLSKDRVEG